MKKRTGLCCLSVLLSVSVCAQTDSLRIPSMEAVYRQNFWLAGENPVALSFNDFRSFSIAEAGYSRTNGNFGKVTDPAATDAYSMGSESYQTLGKVSLYGKLEYKQTRKRDMNWNGMTGSDWQAINLCDSVAGNQRAEQYQLASAFSVPLHSRWLIGGALDYQVQLTAKDADPRNKNQWMELQLSPGVGYRYGKYRLGVSFLYNRKKEEVDFMHVGSHATYPVFAAYPLGFIKTISRGEKSTWYYSGEEFGGALQLDFKPGPLQLFQQISAGTGGQAILSNRAFNRSEGETDVWRAAYIGKLHWLRLQNRHEITLQASFRQAKGYDNLQRQDVNGFWQSYGRTARSEHQVADYALTYGFYQQRDVWNNRFSVLGGVKFHQEETTLLFYPAAYSQPIHRFTVHAVVTRQWLLPGAQIDLSVGGEYGTGGGVLQKEKPLGDQAAPDIPFWQNSELMRQAFAYGTAARWSLSPSVRYTRFMRSTPLAYFIHLSGQYEHADNTLPDQNKSNISVSVGLLF